MARINSKKNLPRSLRGSNDTVYILVDGHCEYDYLNAFKRHDKYIKILKNIDIKPELPKSKSIDSQYEDLLEQLNHYSKVIWLVDYDVIIKESLERGKGKESPEQKFQRYVDSLYKEAKRLKDAEIHILINNPSIEYWYLLHYEPTSKYYKASNDAERVLKKHLKTYTKSTQNYRQSMFKTLEPNLSNAITRAKLLPIDPTEIRARADIYKIFENSCKLLTDFKKK